MTDLPASETWARLAAAPVARLALTEAAMPVIVPVRHRVVGNGVVFGIGGGRLLRAALARDVVCIEADAETVDSRWSVCATGLLEIVSDQRRAGELRALVPPPWDGGRINHVVCLNVAVMTGVGTSIGSQASTATGRGAETITGH